DDEQFIDAYWACILGGYVPVPLSVGISDEHKMRVFQVLQKLNRPFVYTEHVNFNRILNFARERGFYDVFKKFETHRLLTEQITDLSQPGEVQDAQPDDIAFIQFSSGSTRAPKGVSLTHGNLVANLDGIGKGTRLRPEDSLLSWMPLTHDMGLIGMHLSSLFQGIDQYLMPTDKFVRNPMLWMQKVSEHGVTVTSSPNFGYKHFLNAFRASKMEGVDLATLRVIYNGAEPISLPLINKFQETLAPYGLSSRAMFPVYGLAEASLAVSVSELEAEPKAHFLHRDHLNTGDEVKEVAAEDQNAVAFLSVGKAVAHTEWGIYSEDGQALPEGHIGLIWIRGKNVTLGYYNDPEISQEIQKADGWLNTEDLGVSMDGNLVITGRAKEVIFLNGQNFYPQDLEKIIIEQGYSEIGKIAITAFRPENSSEDHILAFLIHKGKAEKFVDTMKAVRILINQELGLEIKDVIPVRQLPKTTSGKIRRIQLVHHFREGAYKELLEELDQLSQEKVDTGLAI
ncbi:MAG: AMP-binding protein, partial [Bacteroidota bacterium]